MGLSSLYDDPMNTPGNVNVEWDLDEPFQYGYAHETRVDVWGHFTPIEGPRGQRWYPSREAAVAAMHNDLRWQPSTKKDTLVSYHAQVR